VLAASGHYADRNADMPTGTAVVHGDPKMIGPRLTKSAMDPHCLECASGGHLAGLASSAKDRGRVVGRSDPRSEVLVVIVLVVGILVSDVVEGAFKSCFCGVSDRAAQARREQA
jgi:hypothetical protein